MKKHLTYIFILMLLQVPAAIAQCPNDNTAYLSGPAPTTVGASVYAPQTWGGDYNILTGMQAGYTYEISTCASPTFDSEITIYPASGGAAVGYDDDGCGTMGGPSKIMFTPAATGDYHILLDEYNCIDNQIDMEMQIKLISTGGVVNPGSLVIPVVVHVVYKNATENVSVSQIMSQIDALNRDYRKTNPDFSNAPGAFQPLGADMDITFCLASIDPNGNPTTGITTTSTTVQGFSQSTEPKSTATGGKDNWNPNKYLNLWVCDLSSSLLGYATFPTDLASDPDKDGVVIDYTYFGTIGTSTSPFDKGRTATHEVGHWLNLRHIWGDANCGDDFVSDTPEQQGPNGQCPSFPKVTCSNGPNGDMFMNYMDYVDDACMVMFTTGQKQRANAAIASFRPGLATSGGCVTAINEVSGKSTFHAYPNPASNLVTVDLTGKGTGKYELRLYNMMGEEIRSHRTVAQGNSIFELSVENLPDGVYLMELRNSEKLMTKRLVVQ